MTRRELVAHVDDHLSQPLLVCFGLLELGDEPVDFRAVGLRLHDQLRFAMY